MGPLYFAGGADELKMCIDQVRKLVPDEIKTYVEQYLDIRPNKGAGAPELSKQWNQCLAMVEQLAMHYTKGG